MALFLGLLVLAVVAPAFPLLVAWLDRPALAVVSRRQFVRHAAVAGSLGILPAGFLFTLGAYGDWIVLLLIAILGGLYGALVGTALSWLRPRQNRDGAG
jgi:hypothetical protein